MKKFASLMFAIVMLILNCSPICYADDESSDYGNNSKVFKELCFMDTYPNTEIPVYKFPFDHTVYNNHLEYWYGNVSEEEFHYYRHKLEDNGFSIYDTVNNSDYFVDYDDSVSGITVRYSRDLSYTSEIVYVCFEDKQNRMSVQVCDTEGLYDVVTASDNVAFHPGCTGALLYYRCGYYSMSMSELNDYIKREETLDFSQRLSHTAGAFFNQLYADVEYAIKYSDAIYDWIDKITNYYDNGLYYEALAELGWLRQTYKLPPWELSYVQYIERKTQESLNNYQFYTGLSKAIDYYNKGMYNEAKDELRWIKDIPIEIQEYVDAYNELMYALYN